MKGLVKRVMIQEGKKETAEQEAKYAEFVGNAWTELTVGSHAYNKTLNELLDDIKAVDKNVEYE